MKALWLFIFVITFCIYVLFGLHLTEGVDTLTQIILSWVIYTILCITFLNVFILGYFWSVVRKKNGPAGIRGPSGERGKVGSNGQCNINDGRSVSVEIINTYINDLYKSKTGQSILNEETQKFPNTYLNDKIKTMAGSRQYQVLVANLSNYNKPIVNIINYLKSIWFTWFELLYNATKTGGIWFTDEFADEEYEWSGVNPFNEIKKYDVYYWGITRDFRPLKAELCRSNNSFISPKSPLPNKPLEPRLKIIQTNDYYKIGTDRHSGIKGNSGFYQAKSIEIGNDSYYSLGSIMTGSDNKYKAWYQGHDEVITGDFKYNKKIRGPSMRTILVAGDIKSPVGFKRTKRYKGDDDITLNTPICPKGYIDLGDVASRIYKSMKPKDNNIKCVPEDCVEEVSGKKIFSWRNSGDNYVLNTFTSGNLDANGENGYNLFRGSSGKPFYKIKDSCLVVDEKKVPITKDVEEQNGDLGIGWYGHPYKIDPKYSIFTFLNLLPEGMIVHKGTGRRFYILHYGGEEANIYNVLDYNEGTNKYDNALQADSNSNNSKVKSRNISRTDERQQWIIELQSETDDKSKLNKLKLKNYFNKKYLYLGLEPLIGTTQFSTVNINEYKNHPVFSKLNDDQINEGTSFTFISAFGTNLNIINKDNLVQ